MDNKFYIFLIFISAETLYAIKSPARGVPCKLQN